MDFLEGVTTFVYYVDEVQVVYLKYDAASFFSYGLTRVTAKGITQFFILRVGFVILSIRYVIVNSIRLSMVTLLDANQTGPVH